MRKKPILYKHKTKYRGPRDRFGLGFSITTIKQDIKNLNEVIDKQKEEINKNIKTIQSGSGNIMLNGIDKDNESLYQKNNKLSGISIKIENAFDSL